MFTVIIIYYFNVAILAFPCTSLNEYFLFSRYYIPIVSFKSNKTISYKGIKSREVKHWKSKLSLKVSQMRWCKAGSSIVSRIWKEGEEGTSIWAKSAGIRIVEGWGQQSIRILVYLEERICLGTVVHMLEMYNKKYH